MTGLNETCERCRYFVRFTLGFKGDCARYPPTVLQDLKDRLDFMSIYPTVDMRKAWCGEFAPKGDDDADNH